MNHQAIHPPIDPRAVGIFGNYRMPGANVAATIATMDQRNGKFENIDFVAAKMFSLQARCVTIIGLNSFSLRSR